MTDNYYMHLAIEIAKSTVWQTAPNPAVGAVIVKNNKIISFGAHLQSGNPHAEINAINQTSPEELIGATLYVSLEPCCHVGKTQPCTDVIIKSGIKRVVVASLDKNAKVSGKGIEQLKKSGIEVIVGILAKDANEINKMFFHYINTNKPYVTLKAGLSLDAKLATSLGESKWITNEEARRDAHFYRASHDAILVGVGTINNDNPSLTARYNTGNSNPVRIVLDTNLKIQNTAKVINDQLAKTVIITSKIFDEKKADLLKKKSNIQIINLLTEKIDINQVLILLAKDEIRSILVEGGQKIYNSFIQNRLFNELVVYMAPNLIGGSNSYAFFTGSGFATLKDIINLEFSKIDKIGNNLKIVATINNSY